jgi:hypothetical protein
MNSASLGEGHALRGFSLEEGLELDERRELGSGELEIGPGELSRESRPGGVDDLQCVGHALGPIPDVELARLLEPASSTCLLPDGLTCDAKLIGDTL